MTDTLTQETPVAPRPESPGDGESSVPEVVVSPYMILPDDHLILEGIDVSEEPHFSVSEFAKIFFARSSHWVRWLERKGFLVFDGEKVGERRTESGARYYTLDDVEKITHALAERGAIDIAQVTHALLTVMAIAKVYGYIEDTEQPEGSYLVTESAPESAT